MSSRKTPKPNSLNGKRLKRVTQRRAYFAQAGVTIESVRRFDALLEKAGVRVAPEDWEVAIDWALQTYPIDTSRPVALAAIATSYAATLNSANHAASTSSRNLATALSGDPLHAWWMVFGISDEHGTLLGEAPLDVIDETCRTVADHPAWGVLGAARSVYLVASRQVTQVVDERVLRDIVGDDDAARDVLGGKVSRFAVSLAKDLEIPWKESGGADLPRIKADIEAQYGALVEEAIGAGAWPWDEVLAKHLEITGPTGADYAAKIRAASQENMARALAGDSKVGNHAGPGAMLRFWNDPSQQKPLGLRWLSQVAKSLWHDEVKPELDRPTTSVRVYGHGGYSKIPKVVAGMGWAVEGPPMDRTVCLDDVDYGLEPLIAQRVAAGRVLVPRGLALLPSDKRPHQSPLPFEYEADADTLPMALAQASSAGVLSIDAFKAILLAFANTDVVGGDLARGTLAEWTKRVRPYLTRTQARDYQQVAQGFHEADSIRLYLPDGSDLRPFDVRRPTDTKSPERDAEVRIGLTQTFRETLGASFGDNRYRGEFLLDLTGAMNLHGLDGARRLRLYTTIAAHWGAAFHGEASKLGEFNPAMMPPHTMEQWGAMANTLSSAAVEFLRHKTTRSSAKTALSDDRRAVADDMEHLVSAGLIGSIEKKGGGLQPRPPEAHQEAFRQIRKRGARPDQ
mgnify:FL=1